MIALILPFVVSCVIAAPYGGGVYSGLTVLGPSYHAPIVPVETLKHTAPKGGLSYTVSNVKTHTGEIQQHTAVGKDALGGHTIRHSAQASNLDPYSGQSDFKTNEHEFHINPYIGEAAVHTNNAQGSLNPTIGKAAFTQHSHQAKIAPGHSSQADVADTAAVSSIGSAASRDVNAARTDLYLDGIAKNAHSSHKSYSNIPGVAGQSQAFETNHRSFDGHGYGNLHYDTQAANQAYDAHGHASANEGGYKLDHAYDARVNLGATNEVQYSRHASHDPYGNYGAVTQTREASQGGQLVPVQPAVIVEEVAPVPAVVQAPVVVAQKAAVVAAPVAAPVIYSQPAPVSYKEHTSVVYNEPAVYKQPVVYDAHAYGPGPAYPRGGYYKGGY